MDEADRQDEGLQLNPTLIGLLGVIAGAIMVSTYLLFSYVCDCHRRQILNGTANATQTVVQNNRRGIRPSPNTSRSASTTLIPILNYNKNCNEEMCAVCLGDFKEGEQIKVLPDCLHFFHVSCIDTWLNLHSNCPLCRADASTPGQVAAPLPEYSTGAQPWEVSRLPEFGV